MKTKMDDLCQDSQTGLPTEYFALCSEHFEASCFSRSVLIGTPVDFKRFYLEKGSLPQIYAKLKDSLDIDYPRNEGRLANRIFPEKHSLGVSLGPPPSLMRNISIQNPPKENRFLFRLAKPIRDMLSVFRDDISTTLSTRMGLF